MFYGDSGYPSICICMFLCLNLNVNPLLTIRGINSEFHRKPPLLFWYFSNVSLSIVSGFLRPMHFPSKSLLKYWIYGGKAVLFFKNYIWCCLCHMITAEPEPFSFHLWCRGRNPRPLACWMCTLMLCSTGDFKLFSLFFSECLFSLFNVNIGF